MPPFTLGLIQMRMTADNAANVAHACELLERAAAQGVQVACLPELQMNRYLIDTNVISETSRAKPDKAALDWLSHTPKEQQFISALTLAEITMGLEKARQDPPHYRRLIKWRTEILTLFRRACNNVRRIGGHMLGRINRLLEKKPFPSWMD